MPLRDNISFNLYPNSEIKLHPDAGCWWEKVKQRLDKGSFKKFIAKKFGKDNEYFSHYFERRKKNKKFGWNPSENVSERLTKVLCPLIILKKLNKKVMKNKHFIRFFLIPFPL